MSLRVLGIVPARMGSKRLPGKNTRLLGGKELVRWAIEASLGSQLIHSVVVSSDDPKVLEIADQYSVSEPRCQSIMRPPELADDLSPALEYVRHALRFVEASLGRFDAVAIVQPSSPFTRPTDIDGTIEMLSTGTQSAVSIVRVPHDIHPSKFKKRDVMGNLAPLFEAESGGTMAHEMSDVYVRNGSVYVCRRESIDRGTLLRDPCRGFLMPRDRSVDINDQLDLEFAEFLALRSASSCT